VCSVCCSVRCSALQCVAVFIMVMHEVSDSVLQCVAVFIMVMHEVSGVRVLHCVL